MRFLKSFKLVQAFLIVFIVFAQQASVKAFEEETSPLMMMEPVAKKYQGTKLDQQPQQQNNLRSRSRSGDNNASSLQRRNALDDNEPIKCQDVTQFIPEQLIQESAQLVPQILVAGDADDKEPFKNIQFAWNDNTQDPNYQKRILQHLTTSFSERKYFGIDPNNQRHLNRLSTFLRNRLESNDFENREILREGLSQLTQGSDEEFEQGKLFSSSPTLPARRRSVSEPLKMSHKEESLTLPELRKNDLSPLTKEEIEAEVRKIELTVHHAGIDFQKKFQEIDSFRIQPPTTHQAVQSFISAGERFYGKELMEYAMVGTCSGQEAALTLEQVQAILTKADTVIANTLDFLKNHPYIPTDFGQDIALYNEIQTELDAAKTAYEQLGTQEKHLVDIARHAVDRALRELGVVSIIFVSAAAYGAVSGAIIATSMYGIAASVLFIAGYPIHVIPFFACVIKAAFRVSILTSIHLTTVASLAEFGPFNFLGMEVGVSAINGNDPMYRLARYCIPTHAAATRTQEAVNNLHALWNATELKAEIRNLEEQKNRVEDRLIKELQNNQLLNTPFDHTNSHIITDLSEEQREQLARDLTEALVFLDKATELYQKRLAPKASVPPPWKRGI